MSTRIGFAYLPLDLVTESVTDLVYVYISNYILNLLISNFLLNGICEPYSLLKKTGNTY